MKPLFVGLCFTFLWSSASIATKFGINSGEPLILASIRFLVAGILLIIYCYLLNSQKYEFPQGKDWQKLIILGFLNTTLYLGCFFTALQTVSAGLASLFTATNPLIITIISSVWLQRKVNSREWIGICLATSGLIITTIPSLRNSYATVNGLMILSLGMISFSTGSVYLLKSKLMLPSIVINTWQVMIGGILLLPFALLFNNFNSIKLDINFCLALFWLVLPVSIVAMQIWLYLLKKDTVRAGTWLLLTPIFGYCLSALLLNEPITKYVVLGTFLVVLGLYIAKKH